MLEDSLKAAYAEVLGGITADAVWTDNDRYSGVFLPIPFDAYQSSSPKVMLIGRETAGWLSRTSSMQSVISANECGTTEHLVELSLERYRRHLRRKSNGDIITTSRSRFVQYYFRLVKALRLTPDALVYANLLAWDYNKRTPLRRPAAEVERIISYSQQLLAVQIKAFRPDYMVFATGCSGVIDNIIRGLFTKHFDGYETIDVESRRFWEFRAAEAQCFRIAHPRASLHGAYRDKVIARILQCHGQTEADS